MCAGFMRKEENIKTLLADTVVNDFPSKETYILIGGSNANGNGLISSLSAHLKNPLDSCFIYVPCEFQVLDAGINNLGRQISTTKHGIEESFLDSMSIVRNNQIRMVKFGNGNTLLTNQWKPDDDAIANWTYTKVNNFLMTVLSVEAAKANAYRDGVRLDIKAVIIFIGEDDQTAAASPYYGSTLYSLITRLRTFLHNPNLKAIIIKTRIDDAIYGPVVRTAEDSVAALEPTNIFTVETNDLPGSTSVLLTSAQLVTVGYRVADICENF